MVRETLHDQVSRRLCGVTSVPQEQEDLRQAREHVFFLEGIREAAPQDVRNGRCHRRNGEAYAQF